MTTPRSQPVITDFGGSTGESVLTYCRRILPEFEWESVASLNVQARIKRIFFLSVEDRIERGGYATSVQLIRAGSWYQSYSKDLRHAVVRTLAMWLDVDAPELPYFPRFLSIHARFWKGSQWRRDALTLEQEILAAILELPAPSLEVGQLTLAEDKTGALSLT